MANRYTTQYVNCLQKGLSVVIARITFGGDAVPTIDRTKFNSEGLFSFTRNGTGLYTAVFGTLNNNKTSLDVYPALLNVVQLWDTTITGVQPSARDMYLVSNNVAVPQGTANACSCQIQFNTSGSPTDPSAGEAVMLSFWLKNSTAP